MGRKPKNGVPENIYFGPVQEEWFLKYIEETDKHRKDYIYFKHLREPFETMVDLVMKKYVNIPTGLETFDGVKEKMFSHLGWTLNGYKHQKGRKAYSYFSNVLKHYGWQIIRESQREKKEHISYDDVASNLENDNKLSYQLTDEQQEFFDLLFVKLINSIQTELTESDKKPSKNEETIGNALIELFTNREFIFDNLGESKKFDKSYIITTLKEQTGLNTKEIRESMVRFKTLYYLVKKSDLNEK